MLRSRISFGPHNGQRICPWELSRQKECKTTGKVKRKNLGRRVPMGAKGQAPVFRNCGKMDPMRATLGQGWTSRASRSVEYLLPKKEH